MWSAAVLEPALPGRSRPVSASLVLSQNASTGWKPQVCLNVAAACSFSECAIVMVASSSITSTGRPSRDSNGAPHTSDAGSAVPLTSARSAQATSRAVALAASIAFSSASPIAPSTRQHVESEATDPNTPGW